MHIKTFYNSDNKPFSVTMSASPWLVNENEYKGNLPLRLWVGYLLSHSKPQSLHWRHVYVSRNFLQFQ